MLIHYIDAENVGAATVQHLSIRALDRAFVFCNHPVTAAPHVTHISGYPTGANQADFQIVAHLAQLLVQLTKAEKAVISFLLHTRDKALWMAFEHLCARAGAHCHAPLLGEAPAPAKPIAAPAVTPAPAPANEDRLLRALTEPMTSKALRAKVKLDAPTFNRRLTRLVADGKIVKASGSTNATKVWRRAAAT